MGTRLLASSTHGERTAVTADGSMYVCALLTPELSARRCCAGCAFALVVLSTTCLEHDFMAFFIGEGRRTGT